MQLLPIMGVIITAVSLVIVSIFGINDYFNQEIKKQEKEIIYDKIYTSKKDIKSVYGLLESTNRIVKKSFKREVKVAVEVGYNLVDTIYKQNKNYPKEIVLQKIRDNLRNIRFYSDKSGYYFIYDLTGKVIMLPVNSALEGTSFWNFKDITHRYVIRDLIKRLRSGENEIFDEWYYYKPNTKKIEKKFGYIKYFKPLNIFIGSAVYDSLVKRETNKRILQVVSKLNLDSNLILLNKNGKVLYSKDRSILNKNILTKYKKIINKAVENNKNIVQLKIDNKFIIFNYFKNLNTVIMTEIDLDKLHEAIDYKKESINQVVSLVIQQFLITALVILAVLLLITIKLTKLVKNTFKKYESELVKEKEKAENAAKVKSEFLANMSHEIRTPLNAMFGFIKILQEKELDEESDKYLSIIEKSGENLLTIINDILDFSKIEAGKFAIEKIEFNPKEEIEVIHELFASKASEKNILLEINEKNLKYNLLSDPTRIKQVIANLLSNAIKFTHNNKKITLNVEYYDDKESLFVEVIDEGIGISSEKLITIFEAFSQADNSTTRKYGGTGLGLTISYKLVNLLGGELKVESEVDKGSRFYFEIPTKKVGLAKDIKHKLKHNIEHQIFNYHILVVEDNAANQMFMKVILKKMGVTFDIANNGEEAVKKFSSNKYDLILMDENMPKMNGIEATKKIRLLEREKNLDYTIIVALTANAIAGDKERFILAGMDYYLSKPLDIDRLTEIFEKVKK